MSKILDSIKSSVQTIGEGFSNIGKGVMDTGKSLFEGAKKAGTGLLKGDPSMIKDGLKEGFKGGIMNGGNEVIKGVGQGLGGAAGTLVGASPVGMLANHFGNGAASRIASGTFTGLADTVVKGRNGAVAFGEGIKNGDAKQAMQGALDYAKMASLVVPGLGAASATKAIGTSALKSGVKSSAMDEGMGQAKYKLGLGEKPGTETA